MRNPLVTGPRIYLRLMDVDDARVLSEANLIETETWFLEEGRMPTSILSFRHWLKEREGQQPPRELGFAICRRDTDEMIGVTTIRDLDWINRNGETGTGIFRPEFRGSGYGTEAKMLALKYGFEVLGLHAIKSDVFGPNTRSAVALAKQGYRPAGRIEADVCRYGTYYDTLLFDVLRPEWEVAYAAWLERQHEP
jgi:RimJ/RimL family protein N-acetyltransferase